MKRQPATVRIAAGQGFWGDWLEAPYRQVTGGPVDYLMMDYLAEVTMSILQKQKSRDPSLGYAKDFIPLMERILPIVAERRIKVTANAGGVNPRGCAQAVAEIARRLRLSGKLRIGVVTGDDLLGRLDGLLARGHELRNLDTNGRLSDVRDRVVSANAYLGAWPVVEALRRGADVVVTGRVTDTGLTLAPMIHAFGWQPDSSPQGPSQAIRSNAARNAVEATAWWTGNGSQTSPMSATRSWTRRRMGRSRSPSIPAPAGGSVWRA